MMKVEEKTSNLLKFNTVVLITLVSAIVIDTSFSVPTYDYLESIHVSFLIGFSISIFGVIGLTRIARKIIILEAIIERKLKEWKN